MTNYNELPDATYNALLYRTLQVEDLLQGDRATEAHRNSERVNAWRLRALVRTGHWPNGNVGAWRRASHFQVVDQFEHKEGRGFRHACLLAVTWTLVFYAIGLIGFALLALKG